MAVKASDQISVVDLTDGYSVMLTSDSASFAANASGKALADTTFVAQVVAMRGVETIQPSITAADIVCKDASGSTTNNITASVSTSSPYSALNPGISITVKAAYTGNTAEVVIPVVLENNITIEKKFSISASKTGAAGTSYYTHIRYGTSSSGAGMTPTPSASTTYIGIYVGTSSSAPTSASSYTWSKYTGDNGSSSYTHIRYSANADGTDFVTTPTASTLYVGIAVTNSSTAPTAKGSYTWSKYVGDDGEDAITMTITSSNGTIFKNTSIATTLTAHVYQGGAEVAASRLVAGDLGVVKWYKDGGSTAVGTGQTLSITAGQVTNRASYVAQLEK